MLYVPTVLYFEAHKKAQSAEVDKDLHIDIYVILSLSFFVISTLQVSTEESIVLTKNSTLVPSNILVSNLRVIANGR